MPQWFGGDCLVDLAPKAFLLQQWPEMKTAIMKTYLSAS